MKFNTKIKYFTHELTYVKLLVVGRLYPPLWGILNNELENLALENLALEH